MGKHSLNYLPTNVLENLATADESTPTEESPSRKRKQTDTKSSKRQKSLNDSGIEIVSLSGTESPGKVVNFKEQMLYGNRIARQSSSNLVSQQLKQSALKRRTL